MAKGSTLTATQLRNAKPIDQLPWELKRKYAAETGSGPAYYSTFGDAKAAIAADLKKVAERYGKFMRGDDKERIWQLAEFANALKEPAADVVTSGMSFVVEGVVDEWSGVKYSATIVRR